MINKEKELKRLSRRELVDVIYQMKKNEQRLEEEIEELKTALEDKRLRISNAGSLSDAAAEITRLFSTAQSTADLYLQEITAMKSDTELQCSKMLDDAKKSVEKTLSDGEKKIAEIESRYRNEHKKWKRLGGEVKKLEQMKKELCEDAKNGK